MNAKAKGLVAAVFTPFNEKNEINVDVIPKYGEYLAKKGIKAILVNGTLGEGTSLTVCERKTILETWMEVSKTTSQSVIVQIGGTNFKQVEELAAHAEALGVSGILCLPDLYYKPKSTEELVSYLKRVAKAAKNTPLLYYHIPNITGVQVDVRTLLEMAHLEIPTLAGIKFSHPVLTDELKCLPVHGGKFAIYHGYDQTLSAAFVMGVENFMITAPNYAAESIWAIRDNVKNGRNSEALNTERKLMMLTGFIMNMTSWVSGYKAVTSLITGIDLGNPRFPLLPLQPNQLDKLREELSTKGWIK